MTPLELLSRRRSIRSFTKESLRPEHVKRLKALITMINTHQQGLKFQLITEDPDPLEGFSKSYGVFTNPSNYVAAVVDTAAPDVYERAGYYAEQLVMSAVESGIGTCFVGGTYKEDRVKAQLRAGERILFLVLLGYPFDNTRLMARVMAKFVHLRHMTPDQFFEPESEAVSAVERIPILKDGLEAVSYAPSALNRRPVRIFVKEISGEEMVCAKVDASNPKNLIDLGIAKYNYNFATGTECVWGNGMPLSGGESYL